MTTIQQLRELEKEATEAPWEAGPERGEGYTVFAFVNTIKLRVVAYARGLNKDTRTPEDRSNALLIVALRNAAPHLFAVVEAAEGLLIDAEHNQHGMAPLSPLIKALADFRNAK